MKKSVVIAAFAVCLFFTGCVKYVPIGGDWIDRDRATFFIKNRKYGMMEIYKYNKTRKTVIPAIYDTLYWHDAPCGFIAHQGDKKVFYTKEYYSDIQSFPFKKYYSDSRKARTGYIFYESPDSLYVLYDGLSKAKDNMVQVDYYNQSRSIVYGPCEDFYKITSNQVAMKKNGLWGLYNEGLGKYVLPHEYRRIYAVLYYRYGFGCQSGDIIDVNYLLLVQDRNGEWNTLDYKGRPAKGISVSPEILKLKVMDFEKIRRNIVPGWRVGSRNLSYKNDNGEVGFASIDVCVGNKQPIFLINPDSGNW